MRTVWRGLGQPRILRRIGAALLVIGLAPSVWLYEPLPPEVETVALRFAPVALPDAAVMKRKLGAFRLEAAWHVTSAYARFGGYSAMVPQRGGHLLAFSDRGYRLSFSPPGAPAKAPSSHLIIARQPPGRELYDAESATSDPTTGRVWIGWENDNTITRHAPDFRSYLRRRPAAMRGWGINSGPEAMARLADGRFIVLREGFSSWSDRERHKALLFAHDPLERATPRGFTFVGPEGFSPTDMAQLPDGRVLILMRRVVWPLPARFEGRIVLADPKDIRIGGLWRGKVVAVLSPPLPVDNFEGLAVEPGNHGRITVWMISDDNAAAFQRTLLWRMSLDPARLPALSGSPKRN